jgi:hypothetical protein
MCSRRTLAFRSLAASLVLVSALGVLSVSRGHPPAPSPEEVEKAVLVAGHSSARYVFSISLIYVPELVATTAGFSGGKFTGTLSAAHGQQSQYAAEPNDRLVWKSAGCKPREYFIAYCHGNISNSGANYLFEPHALKFRLVVEGETDIEITSTRAKTGYYNQRYELRAKGWLVYNGKKYDVDLVKQGNRYYEGGRSGYENKDAHTLSGTIVGPDFHLTAAESYYYEAISDGGTDVRHDWEKNQNKVVAGGKTYQWHDMMLKKVYKNDVTRNVSTDWICRGQVLADGQPVATYVKDIQRGMITYKMDTKGGPYEFGRWPMTGE